MKLWLLNRTDNIGYDEYAGYVIAAETENEARLIAAVNHADEGSEVWEGQLTCTAECIADATNREAGIILESFNAG